MRIIDKQTGEEVKNWDFKNGCNLIIQQNICGELHVYERWNDGEIYLANGKYTIETDVRSREEIEDKIYELNLRRRNPKSLIDDVCIKAEVEILYWVLEGGKC